LLKETANNWVDHKDARLGAALAYYSIFSVGPLVLIAIAVAGLLFGQDAVRGEVSAQMLLIVAKKAFPANGLRGFIAWLKANPDKATEGHAGIGSAGHIGGIFLQKETGTRFGFAPYRGGAPAMQDLVAGHIDFLFSDGGTSLPYVRSGQIKAYAIAATTRLALAPDVPTADEAGLPRYYVSNWTALWVPKGTPKGVITKLNDAVVSTLADPVKILIRNSNLFDRKIESR
jgi:tripartite-type tricarboxylate transporter receptor subunit TctC